MSSFARSSQMNFMGKPSPSSWMITGHSSCDIHSGSGLAAVSCVRRSPSRIWRTRRREQPRAVAISRRLRPSARRRLISSCLSTVNTLRAIQLSRSCSATTVLDCEVSGPKPGFLGVADNGPPQTAQERRSGTTRTEATEENRPICADIAVPLLEPGDGSKDTSLRVEKRLRPVVPFRRNQVGPITRNPAIVYKCEITRRIDSEENRMVDHDEVLRGGVRFLRHLFTCATTDIVANRCHGFQWSMSHARNSQSPIY